MGTGTFTFTTERFCISRERKRARTHARSYSFFIQKLAFDH
jgi:hypothetical protein